MTDKNIPNTGPLKGIRVFDMSRVLAGPSATQILGDLGADVIKIEKPGDGDDTRKWGPPYIRTEDGSDSSESSYYLSANRNKRSVTLDLAKPEGQALAKRLIKKSDILFENFKTGTMEKYGLGYEQIKTENPGLIYCSLTGFGHSGPYKDLGGYDFMIQAMGGIMSLTGAKDGDPSKVGVAITDLMAGMYALTAILAALHHRNQTGRGQFIDTALLDTQVAWLSNAGQYYLTSGKVTPRVGNAHPSIVPYEAFRATDGYIVLAVGNDSQFQKFCDVTGRKDLSADVKFATNKARVINREALSPIIASIIKTNTQKHWVDVFEHHGVPAGPVNNLQQVFDDPQVVARGMVTQMDHPHSPGPVKLIASPLRLSDTPVSYRAPPPVLGQHTDEVFKECLGLDSAELERLKKDKVI